MRKLFVLREMMVAASLILITAGCLYHHHSAKSQTGIVAVSPAMVRSNEFHLAWDSVYEHQTNILLHDDGTKTVTVARNTNIVYTIYMSSKPTAPMSKWQRVATVDTTNYTCVVTSFPTYFIVRTMDVRSKLESAPGK
jgi:hypothetical protein